MEKAYTQTARQKARLIRNVKQLLRSAAQARLQSVRDILTLSRSVIYQTECFKHETAPDADEPNTQCSHKMPVLHPNI